MSVYQWLCVLGIPSIITGMLAFVKVWMMQNKAIKLGLQAILRDRLLQAFKFYAHQGWADDDDKRNIQNIYKQYEALGENGIMQRKYDKFLSLPDEPINPYSGGNVA